MQAHCTVRDDREVCSIHAIKYDSEHLTPKATIGKQCPVCNTWYEPGVHACQCKPPNVTATHYKGEGLEAYQVIQAFKLGFNLGNVIKYVLRADHKGQRNSDLDKAIDYLWQERYGTWRPSNE